MSCGGDHPGYRDGRQDGRLDAPALKPHRLAGQQAGRHRGVGGGQFLDGDRAENVAHLVQDLLGPQHPGRGDRRVQQPQNGAFVNDFAQSASSSSRSAASTPPTRAPIDEPAIPTIS